MGDIAHLPVNLFTCRVMVNHCFNGRHCPPPCQQVVRLRKLLFTVSMGDIAHLPVNFTILSWSSSIVSMGDIAHLPVNKTKSEYQPRCSVFQWATLPTSLSTKDYHWNMVNSLFQWATLPTSLSTRDRTDKRWCKFQWATLPTSLSTEIGQLTKLTVSMGDIAHLPVNPTPKIYLLISIGYKPNFGTIFDLKSRLFGMYFA